MLPVRVSYCPNGTFYGYGPSSQEVQEMSSTHQRGKEPLTDQINVFGKPWQREAGSFMWGDVVYLRWVLRE